MEQSPLVETAHFLNYANNHARLFKINLLTLLYGTYHVNLDLCFFKTTMPVVAEISVLNLIFMGRTV